MFVELLDNRGEVHAMSKKQNIVIKGTKEGLTLHLNDKCSYEELLAELEGKLDVPHYQEGSPLISVNIQAGNRYLTNEEIEEIKDLVRKKKNLVVEDVISNVMTKEEALRWKEENEIVSVTGMIRSGQVLEVPGDLLLIGDVNPGGTVMAGGNIFIMGTLRGVAHAGCFGNEEAVIVASKMLPSQLRISHYLNRAPDRYDDEETRVMECAYIDDSSQIVVDQLHVLRQIRPGISRFKGGSYNG